jgi:hypothetical protein
VNHLRRRLLQADDLAFDVLGGALRHPHHVGLHVLSGLAVERDGDGFVGSNERGVGVGHCGLLGDCSRQTGKQKAHAPGVAARKSALVPTSERYSTVLWRIRQAFALPVCTQRLSANTVLANRVRSVAVGRLTILRAHESGDESPR